MAADGSGAIGPVSARYAAQIRELLFAQAVQRVAADQEAARAKAEADRNAASETVRPESVRQPLQARIEASEATAPVAPATLPTAPSETRAATPHAVSHLVDIQA